VNFTSLAQDQTYDVLLMGRCSAIWEIVKKVHPVASLGGGAPPRVSSSRGDSDLNEI